MNDSKVRWEEMLPGEFIETRDRCPVCYLAYGLAEPHGTYNALGLDFLKARELVERGARLHGGIVAPPFAWHIQELPQFHIGPDGWLHQAGIKQPLSSSIPSDLFYRMLLYQIRAADARGFHAAILVTGHYGGLEKTMRLLCEFYTRRTGSPLRLHACADWELIDYGGMRGDHAGATETSQLMFLRPDLVDLSKQQAPEELGSSYGGTSFPDKNGRSPSVELGEKIVTSQLRTLGEIKDRLLGERQPKADWVAPSLTDLEAVWHRFERIAGRYWWAGTYTEYKCGARLEFPGWEALGE